MSRWWREKKTQNVRFSQFNFCCFLANCTLKTFSIVPPPPNKTHTLTRSCWWLCNPAKQRGFTRAALHFHLSAFLSCFFEGASCLLHTDDVTHQGVSCVWRRQNDTNTLQLTDWKKAAQVFCMARQTSPISYTGYNLHLWGLFKNRADGARLKEKSNTER